MATAIETPSAPSQQIVIEGDGALILDLSVKRRPAFEEHEARILTTEIQRTEVRLWLLVTEAHDRKAHAALGYESWEDYVRAELRISPSRSYQLIDTGHVMRALAEAGADVQHMVPPPTRVVSRIKDRLPAVRKATAAAIKRHESPDKALRELSREARPPRPSPARGGGGVAEAEAKIPEQATSGPGVGTGRGLVTCPACDGDGKVTRSMANRLRTFISDIKSKGSSP